MMKKKKIWINILKFFNIKSVPTNRRMTRMRTQTLYSVYGYHKTSWGTSRDREGAHAHIQGETVAFAQSLCVCPHPPSFLGRILNHISSLSLSLCLSLCEIYALPTVVGILFVVPNHCLVALSP